MAGLRSRERVTYHIAAAAGQPMPAGCLHPDRWRPSPARPLAEAWLSCTVPTASPHCLSGDNRGATRLPRGPHTCITDTGDKGPGWASTGASHRDPSLAWAYCHSLLLWERQAGESGALRRQEGGEPRWKLGNRSAAAWPGIPEHPWCAGLPPGCSVQHEHCPTGQCFPSDPSRNQPGCSLTIVQTSSKAKRSETPNRPLEAAPAPHCSLSDGSRAGSGYVWGAEGSLSLTQPLQAGRLRPRSPFFQKPAWRRREWELSGLGGMLC